MKFYAASCVSFLIFFSINKINAQSPAEMLETWSLKSPIEKTYLHFDRDNYLAGEVAWFKAYLLSEFLPDTISTNLFTELVDAKENPVAKKVFPIQFATARGQFELPDSLPTGFYTVRAYTQTQLNHDNTFLFQKKLFVYGKKTNALVNNGNNEPKIEFFPEAGQFIQGEVNRIAFKITDANGDPLNANGFITTGKNDTVTNFSSYHDGMGYFNLFPAAGSTYYAVLMGANTKQFVLPTALASGVLLKVTSKPTAISYEVIQPTDVLLKASYMIGQMQHKIAFTQPIKDATSSISGMIDTKTLPSGILQLTLFNKEHIPLAERLVFIDNKEYLLAANVKVDTLSFSPRGQNVFSVAMDEEVRGSFSVAITDAEMDLSTVRESNIVSTLLLTSDISGNVHQPSWYFNTVADSALAGKDLLMMVNGWRRFKWTALKNKVSETLLYKDAGYISIAGKANIRDSKRPVVDKQLMFMMRSVTDSLRPASMQLAATNDKGEFRLDSLIFAGKTVFSASDVSDKQKKWLDIVPVKDSITRIGNAPVFNRQLLASRVYPGVLNNMQVKLGNDLSALLAGEGKVLEEISVKTRKKSPTQLLDEKYASGMFSSGNASVIDLVNTEERVNQANILDYLQGRVPGVAVTRYNTTDYFVQYRNARSLMGGPIPMIIYLDEVLVDVRILSTVPANQVAMIKVMSSFAGAEGNAPGGVLAVYTKKGGDRMSAFDTNVSYFTYNGYAITKDFYDAEKRIYPDTPAGLDNRITLHWEPAIFLMGDTKNIPIKFINTDRTKQFKVVVEGVTTDGRLLKIEKNVAQ